MKKECKKAFIFPFLPTEFPVISHISKTPNNVISRQEPL
jgi:hypothetical protein